MRTPTLTPQQEIDLIRAMTPGGTKNFKRKHPAYWPMFGIGVGLAMMAAAGLALLFSMIFCSP